MRKGEGQCQGQCQAAVCYNMTARSGVLRFDIGSDFGTKKGYDAINGYA